MMKKSLLAFLVLILLQDAFTQVSIPDTAITRFKQERKKVVQYDNPVLPGFFPDPSVVRVGTDYYLVNSTFQYFPSIIISHSKDLVHWEQIGHVLTKAKDIELNHFFDGMGMWAPDISYYKDTFYVFYCLVQLTKDRHINVRGNYMVKSKSINGPWTTPVQLTFEGNDPSHFIDDDGTHYMAYAAGIPKGRGTKIVKLNNECTKVVGEPKWMEWGNEIGHPEGPHVFKKDGYYYHHIAAGGGVYPEHHQLIARSKNIYGPYEPSPYNPFIAQMKLGQTPRPRTTQQGHAMLVNTQNGEWWAMYLSMRRVDGKNNQLGRETGLDKINWLSDGWPILNEGDGPSEKNWAPDLPVKKYNSSLMEDFSSNKLNPNWEWVRIPDSNSFSLSERKGHLILYTTPFDLDTIAARNILLRREVNLNYSAITKLDFKPQSTERAGLVCYYDTKTYASFSLAFDNGLQLVIEECKKGKRNRVAMVSDIQNKPIYLKVQVIGYERIFWYSYDNKDWKQAGRIANANYLSDFGTSQWGFMGTMVGIYSLNRGSGKRLPADFDFFNYYSEDK